MSVTQRKAAEIANLATKGQNATAIDPLTLILVIAQILDQLAKMYIECRKTPEEAVADAQAVGSGNLMTWLKRRKLWKVVKAAGLPSNSNPVDIYDSILLVGETTTINEMAAIYRGD